MTAREIAKRNQKAEQLKVLQTDDGQFFVETGNQQLFDTFQIGIVFIAKRQYSYVRI